MVRRSGMSFIRKEGRTLDFTASSEQARGSSSLPEYATGRMSSRNSSPERMSSQPLLQSLFLFSWEYLTQIPCGKLEISAEPLRIKGNNLRSDLLSAYLEPLPGTTEI